MAERHKPTTAALQSTTDACAGRFDIGVARGARPHALSRTLTTAVACTTRQFKAASLPHHAQHAAVPNAATQGGLHCARLRAHIVRCTHARTPRPSPCTPIPTLRAGFGCARDAPITANFLLRASPTPYLRRWARSLGVAVLESRSGLAGRGSRGQPTTALGGARALPASLRTARWGARPGYPSGTKMRVLYGTHGVP